MTKPVKSKGSYAASNKGISIFGDTNGGASRLFVILTDFYKLYKIAESLASFASAHIDQSQVFAWLTHSLQYVT
jgi:hypothetical protein